MGEWFDQQKQGVTLELRQRTATHRQFLVAQENKERTVANKPLWLNALFQADSTMGNWAKQIYFEGGYFV